MTDPHSSHMPSDRSLETERRLTLLEEQGRRHTTKLASHEKAILGLAGGMYVLAQDQFPVVAAVIRTAVLGTP